MKKHLWVYIKRVTVRIKGTAVRCFVTLTALLALGTCGGQLSNNASDFGISPPLVFGRRTDPIGKSLALSKPITAQACCEKSEPSAAWPNDGPAWYAVNGLDYNHWHSNEAGTSGVSGTNPSQSGHRGDGELVASGVVPTRGAHWITIDLGQVVEVTPDQIGRLGYQRRSSASGEGNLGNSTDNSRYDLYVSEQPIGWAVDNMGDTIIPIATNATHTSADGLVWINFPPNLNTIKFRYVQLRWNFSNQTATATAKKAAARNIMFKISNTTLDFNYMYSVYVKGIELLKTIKVSSRNYESLHAVIFGQGGRCGTADVSLLYDCPCKQFRGSGLVANPTDGIARYLDGRVSPPADNANAIITRQDQMDAATETVLEMIYRFDPPPKPPVITF